MTYRLFIQDDILWSSLDAGIFSQSPVAIDEQTDFQYEAMLKIPRSHVEGRKTIQGVNTTEVETALLS